MGMKAVILAGGEGRRLKAVTGELPKPMVPLLGKPLMERVIELLRKNGVTEIAATLRYNPAPILAYFGNGESMGVRLRWFIEQEPLGTAGSVKNCLGFTGGEDFLVVSGDAACDFDLSELMREHRRGGDAVTIALCESPEPLRYGLVVPDADGEVRCFIEKPPWQKVVTNLVNTGIYAVSPRAMELVPAGREFDFARDLFPLLLERGEGIRGVKLDGYWCDVGTPEAYYRCCLDALEGRLRLVTPPETLEPAAKAAQEAKREPLEGEYRAERRVPCRDRAGLMRAVSGCLMEAGAELDDGVVLRSNGCSLRISPSAERSEIVIEAAAGSADFPEQLADTAGELVTRLRLDQAPFTRSGPGAGGRPPAAQAGREKRPGT